MQYLQNLTKVGMVNASANWDEWNKIAQNMVNHEDQKVKIAMVGKYVTLWQIVMLV